MTSARNHGLQLDSRTIKRGAWVFGLGSLVSMAGLLMIGNELAAASRRYVQQMEVPPTQRARQGLTQARLAAGAGVSAGAQAWRQASQTGEAPGGSIDLNEEAERSRATTA